MNEHVHADRSSTVCGVIASTGVTGNDPLAGSVNGDSRVLARRWLAARGVGDTDTIRSSMASAAQCRVARRLALAYVSTSTWHLDDVVAPWKLGKTLASLQDVLRFELDIAIDWAACDCRTQVRRTDAQVPGDLVPKRAGIRRFDKKATASLDRRRPVRAEASSCADDARAGSACSLRLCVGLPSEARNVARQW